MSKVILLITAFLALTICSELQAIDHVIYDLGLLDGYRNSVALAVSDNGVVVGCAYNDNVSYGRACVWDETGIRDLGVLLGDTFSYAYSVNNKGQTVGYSYNMEQSHACLWDDSGIHQLPPLPGKSDAIAMGINDKGLIVGFSYNADPAWDGNFACYWDCKGVHPLSTLPSESGWSDYSFATAVSENGAIAGISGTSACSWSKRQPCELTAPVGGTGATPCGINSRGDIGGYAYVEVGSNWVGPVPCVWNSAGVQMLDLLPGYSEGACYGINNRGETIGSSMDYYTVRATCWDRTGVHDLGVLPNGHTSAALGINNYGVIVGSSFVSSNGTQHAVLWQPTAD